MVQSRSEVQETSANGSAGGARAAHHESPVAAARDRIADGRPAGEGSRFEDSGQGRGQFEGAGRQDEMAQEFRTAAGDPAQPGVAQRAGHGAQSRSTRIPQDAISQTAVRKTDRLSPSPNRAGRSVEPAGHGTAVRHARHPL